MAAVLQMLPKRKGRPSVDDGRDVLRLFPRGRMRRSFMYAIAFDGGVVKIGQSTTPRSRLLTHWKTGSGEVKWVHLFESMHTDTAHRVERAIPSALSHIGKQINGSEWFFAEDKTEVLRVVRKVISEAKAAVNAAWDAQAQEREAVHAVTKFMRDNGLLRPQERP